MRDALAERLLAKVMNWSVEELVEQRRILQGLAAFKYDEYQKYAPGRKFLESLAIWLQQFLPEERTTAYDFIRSRLVYISNAELEHIVGSTFQDTIRPFLLGELAAQLEVSKMFVAKLTNHEEYKNALRQSLYLGLSDGARMDILRRSTPEMNHEQVLATYEITDAKAADMLSWMRKGFEGDSERFFRFLFLIDDFSASGRSYLRKREDGEVTGKINKVLQEIEHNNLRGLVDPQDLQVCVVLYVATDHSIQQLEALLKDVLAGKSYKCSLLVAHQLSDEIKVSEEKDKEFVKLLDKYYDASIEDEHTGCVRLGYYDCALPVVLSHNSPNNSVYLLWAESETVRPLFPRVSRHKRER